MGKLNDIRDIIFPKDKQIIELNSKIEDLTARVEKSALIEGLEGVVSGQLISLGTDRYENAYQSNYVVWRGINLLAQSIAALPLQVYKGQALIEPERVQGALKGFDIYNPNKEMSLYELMYRDCIYYWYRGEFMIYINIEDPHISLEPVNPKEMTRNSDGSWRHVTRRDNNIPNDQLIYLPLFNPDNMYEAISDRGLSPIDVVKKELSADDRATDYNTKFFENFGKIGGTLYDEKGQVTADQMKILVDEFNSIHQGSDKAHKTLGLMGGIKYQELGQTMKEMEFLESRKDIRDRVLSILGIHKAVFGVTDKVDRAVADTARRQLWEDTLQPNAIRIQNKLNQHLFKRHFPGYRCVFDFSGVAELQEPQKDKLEQAKGYRDLGYTINEVNVKLNLGMDEVTDPIGDMRLVPTTLMPVDDLYINGDDTSKIISETDDKLDNLVKFLEEDDKIDKAGRNFVRNYRILQRKSEKKIAGKMGNYFATQLGKVLGVIKEEKAVNKINETIVLSDIGNLINSEKEVLTATLTPVFKDISKDASALALKAINVIAEPVVNEAVVGQMINRIVGINNYTYKLIRKEVKDSVLAGESVNQLSKRITNVYKFNSARSRTIARTESGALVNRSTYATYQEHDIRKKQWIGGTRPSHAAINGQIKLFNEPFGNGLMYPHDPAGSAGEVINCTCALAPITGA